MSNKSPKGTATDAPSRLTAKVTVTPERLIGTLQVKPYNQTRMRLGSFEDATAPKGFSVELSPDPDPSDSVDTEVIRSGNGERYTLLMHVANHGNALVNVRVSQLL